MPEGPKPGDLQEPNPDMGIVEPSKVATIIKSLEKYKDDEDDSRLEDDIDRLVHFENLREPLDEKGVVMAFAKLIINLGPKLFEYKTLLSDEITGRVPTLVLKDFINKSVDKEEESPQVLFPLGGRDAEKIHVGTYVDSVIEQLRKRDPLGKTLLVTEVIGSGESIKPFVERLVQEGFDIDIAALGAFEGADSLDSPYVVNSGLENVATRLHFGVVDSVGLWSFSSSKYSPVTKEGTQSSDAWPKVRTDSDMAVIKSMRESIKLLTNELVRLFE